MPARDYHGSFRHPVRSFLVGCGLLILLLGGFAVGTETGRKPGSELTARVVTRYQQRLRVITVPQPVVRTVIDRRTVRVVAPRVSTSRVVVIRHHDRAVLGFLRDGGAAAARVNPSVTVYVPQPVTVTETVPASTVTEAAPPASP